MVISGSSAPFHTRAGTFRLSATTPSKKSDGTGLAIELC